MRYIRSIVVLISLVLAAHVQAEGLTPQGGAMKSITGQVWYRERMLLPPTVEMKVYLEDVSKMDVVAEIITMTSLVPEGGPPWKFVLEYDPAKIDSRHRYALRARIEADGRLLFINTSHIAAFTQPEGAPIDILVSNVGSGRGSRQAEATTPNASLVNTYWKHVELENQPVALGAGKKELHMVLVSEGNGVRGYSGCNRFMGTFEQKGKPAYFREDGLNVKGVCARNGAGNGVP
jgi:putative lipoprotein